MKLLMILLVGGTSAFAADARYSFRAKCFEVKTNSDFYQVEHFGRVTGLSDYSCDNAYENLEIECDRRAAAAGAPVGSVYKDILVVSKEGSHSSSHSEASYQDRTRKGLFSIRERAHRDYHSIGDTQSTVSKTEVEYLYVDPRKDCILDAHFPKADTPTRNMPGYGG